MGFINLAAQQRAIRGRIDQAISEGTTHLTEDGEALIKANGLDVLVEATYDSP